MDFKLQDFKEFCRAYIDDVVIASVSLEDHLDHLHQVLSKFVSLNLAIKASKCFIGYPSATLLGQKVDSFGMSTTTERLEAIASLKFPKTLRELETWLGMTGYLRNYIPHYAGKVALLQQRKTNLLKLSPSNKGSQRCNFACRQSIMSPSGKEMAAFTMI